VNTKFLEPLKKLNAINVFIISILVMIITLLCVWFFDFGEKRTFFSNTIIALSILSAVFFLFVTGGLYYGVKLRDNKKSFFRKENYTFEPPPIFPEGVDTDLDFSDGIMGAIFSIIASIVFSILLFLLIWLLGVAFWTLILAFVAMLYWVFLNALRIVFKNSVKCKGKFFESAFHGFIFTFLYTSWMYLMIFAINYTRKV
jgi:hypothetical protein